MGKKLHDGRRQLALLLIAIAGWLLAFGTMVAYEAKQPRVIGPICAHADVNCDRSIDVLDLQLVVNAVLESHNSRLGPDFR